MRLTLLTSVIATSLLVTWLATRRAQQLGAAHRLQQLEQLAGIDG